MGNLDEADCGSISPRAIAASIATAVLCMLIVWNAVAGQEGRHRDVVLRLSDLERDGTLPGLIGAVEFAPRPTTRAKVEVEPSPVRLERIEKSGSHAAAPSLDVRGVQEGLARLGYSPGAADGELGPKTRDAIRLYERDRNRQETGTITPELVEELQRVLAGGG